MNSNEAAAIREKTSEWNRALREKDAEAAGRFFTDDLVTFDLAPPLKQTGYDRRAMQAWFDTWDGKIGYDVTDQVIEVGDRLAVARSLDHMTGTKKDGEHVDVWTRSTVCFRKEADGWKVMHVHSSVPFYMDGSFKAAIDLRP